MDFEKVNVSYTQDGNHELPQDNPNTSKLTLVENNEKLLSAHKCYNVLQSSVKIHSVRLSGGSEVAHDDTNELSTSTYDHTKIAEVITSDNSVESGMFSCESLQDKLESNDSTENSIQNQLACKITNLNMSADALKTYSSSKKIDQMSSFKSDNGSIGTQESSAHEFLDINESTSTVHSFCDTDSLKTCDNDDSNILNNSDLVTNQLKKCSVKENGGKQHSESKHSSEIKERVMSYLNKHSGSCESSDEQVCNEVIVKEDKLKTESDLCVENCSLKNGKEHTKSSSQSIVPLEPISPVQNFQAVECSSVEVTDVPSIGGGGKSPSLICDVLRTTNNTEIFSDCGENVTIVVSCNSSSGCFNANISNEMEVNDVINVTNDTITDTFTESQLNETVNSGSEMQLSPHSNASCNSLAHIGPVASTYFLGCKSTVEAPDEGGNTLQFCKQRAASSDNSNCSLFDYSLLSFYDKSGTFPTNPPISSWGKLSFQSFTTPSIKFPILSSKSNMKEKEVNAISKSVCTPISNYKYESDDTSAQNKSKNDFNSRKTKSTEALFSNMLFSTSAETFFSDNVSGKSSSKISNLHFVSPIVHTESSWSENCLQKNVKFGTEKTCGDSLSTTDSKIISSSSLGSVASGPFSSVSENPFSKKCSESIGIFNSQHEGFSGFSSVFKPVATIFSSKSEKFTEGNLNFSEDSIKNSFGTNKETEFGVKLNDQNQQVLPSVSSNFVFKRSEQLSDAKDLAFSSGSQNAVGTKDVVVRNQKETEHIHISKAETTTSLFSINSSPFQFKVNSEKFKTPNLHRFTCPRFSRKTTKSHKQNDKGFSKFVREATVFNSTNSLPNAPFKPAHGSDVVSDKGNFKRNVAVRYQNIVCMKEHVNVSPDELRWQYYNKTRVAGPFRFSASAEYNECLNYRKFQNKEVQTDENLVSKKYELSEIWRVLECPVCLDVVMPPVYQCEQGHHACLTCWNKVVTCPLCKRRKSVTRNYMAEALIDQIPLPCKYHIEGCKETVSKGNKVKHEETCPYRMYQCPVPLCKQAHSYQNMCTHFKKVHKSLLHHEGHSVGKGEKFCDVLYKDFLSSSLVHAFDIAKWGLFFLREVVTKHSKALFVQVMPASPEPAAYFYHLEVCDHHDCRKECYKGRVFSMGKPVQEILNEEEYLSLSVLILKTIKKSAPLKIVVTIWQLKPAFSLSPE